MQHSTDHRSRVVLVDGEQIDEEDLFDMQSEAHARNVDIDQVYQERMEERCDETMRENGGSESVKAAETPAVPVMDSGIKIPGVTNRQRDKLRKKMVFGIPIRSASLQTSEKRTYEFLIDVSRKLELIYGSTPEAVPMPDPLSASFTSSTAEVSIDVPGRSSFSKKGLPMRTYGPGGDVGSVPQGTRVRVVAMRKAGAKLSLFEGAKEQSMPFTLKFGRTGTSYTLVIDAGLLEEFKESSANLSTPLFAHFLWGVGFDGTIMADVSPDTLAQADTILMLSLGPRRLNYISFISIPKTGQAPMSVGAPAKDSSSSGQATVPTRMDPVQKDEQPQKSELAEPARAPTKTDTRDKVDLDARLETGTALTLMGLSKDVVVSAPNYTTLTSRYDIAIARNTSDIGERGSIYLNGMLRRGMDPMVAVRRLAAYMAHVIIRERADDESVQQQQVMRRHTSKVLLSMSALMRARFSEWRRLYARRGSDAATMRALAMYGSPDGTLLSMLDQLDAGDATGGLASPDVIVAAFHDPQQLKPDPNNLTESVAMLYRQVVKMMNDDIDGAKEHVTGTRQVPYLSLVISRVIFAQHPNLNGIEWWGMRIMAMIVGLQVAALAFQPIDEPFQPGRIRETVAPYAMLPRTVGDLLEVSE